MAASKTKQFCETSFHNGKLSAKLTASCQCVLRCFHSMCLKYCAYHEKLRPSHTRCCTCHTKSSSQNWRSDAPNATPLRKSAPGPPNISDEHVSCTAHATENASLQILFACPTPANACEAATKPSCLAHFWQGTESLPPETTSAHPKVVWGRQFFTLLTWKCALRHTGVHFFDITTSKSAPTLVFFVHFDLEMCFAPHRRALFRHHNLEKCSYPGVLCTFWLGNVLRATKACAFSASQLPKVVRTWCALYILTRKCALRHKGVHFFAITTSKNGPNMVCFVHFDLEICFAAHLRALFWQLNGVLCTFWLANVFHATTACNFSSLIWPDGSAPAALASLLFDPPEPQIIGKRQCLATFLPFRAPASSFFSLFLFSYLLSSALLLSDSSHLCFLSSLTLPASAFSSVHIVGSLTSKLPSNKRMWLYKQYHGQNCW